MYLRVGSVATGFFMIHFHFQERGGEWRVEAVVMDGMREWRCSESMLMADSRSIILRDPSPWKNGMVHLARCAMNGGAGDQLPSRQYSLQSPSPTLAPSPSPGTSGGMESACPDSWPTTHPVEPAPLRSDRLQNHQSLCHRWS